MLNMVLRMQTNLEWKGLRVGDRNKSLYHQILPRSYKLKMRVISGFRI